MRTCDKCSYYKNNKCTDAVEYVDADTGEPVCRYRPEAVPVAPIKAIAPEVYKALERLWLQDAALEMYAVLKRLINELPTNREWLDPVLESMAKAALAKAEGKKGVE